MTRFLDGPAKDVTIGLRRAPHLLRVVQDRNGNWDALDQVGDVPKFDETVTVYQLVTEKRRVHINRGRAAHIWYEGGDYRVLTAQPSVDVLRDNSRWQAWAREQWPLLQARGIGDAHGASR